MEKGKAENYCQLRLLSLLLCLSMNVTSLLFSQNLADRPNIVLILADDLGYSDLGCYGGEIHTPHLDGLADEGLRFKQFYNNARGAATRASLLTGLYPHLTGMGYLPNPPTNPRGNDYEFPGYRGYLKQNCVTLPEMLKTVGYQTYMSGNWSLGFHGADRRPMERGFDRFYGVLTEGGDLIQSDSPRGVLANKPGAMSLQNGATYEAFTDQALQYLEESRTQHSRPFFLYLSYDSPHHSYTSRLELEEKYQGKYLKGWDRIRDERLNRMIEMGLVDERWGMALRDEKVQPWQELNVVRKNELEGKMTKYAARVEWMDQNIGRICEKLKAMGQWDNTLILFLSDNGGNSKMNPMAYGLGWAHASNTPFAGFEAETLEGGISTPLIAHWPKGMPRRLAGTWTEQWGHVADVLATCLEISGARYPTTSQGKQIPPMNGKSLLAVLEGKNRPVHKDPVFWEHEGNAAVREGDWKLVKKYRGSWKLYNIAEDRTETNDLADQYPEKVERMNEAYEAFVHNNEVLPWKTIEDVQQNRSKRLNTLKKNTDQPNFLFFLADDLTYSDIGCYGSDVVKTPHIDRLASEGMQFNRAFQPSPMCSPSRHSLYTGLYPVQSGAYPNHAYANSGTRSLAHYLSDLGYRVGLAGKTHIAPLESFPFEYIPGDLDWKGIEQFMKRDTDQPFCLFVCSKQPHTPWDKGDPSAYDTLDVQLPPYLVDTEETREALKQYYAEVSYLDGEMGKCMALLKRHKMEDKTVTFFSSEQGNAFPFAKWTCYEAGLRTALIVRWPGKIIPGSTTDAMVEVVDIAPTLVELAGGEKIPYLNGKSLIPVLKGEATRHKEYVFGIQTSLGINNGPASYGIRSVRNERYKYILNLSPKVKFTNVITEKPDNPFWASWVRAARSDPFAKERVNLYQFRPKEELYDLRRDPHEMKNLAGESIYDEIMAELKENLDAWMRGQGDEGQKTELEALKHQKRYLQKKGSN